MTSDGRLAAAQVHDLLPAIAQTLGDYPYDHFRRYPARPAAYGSAAPWEAYLLTRLRTMAADAEWTFFGGSDPTPLLLGARTARWDLDWFGAPISSLTASYCPDLPGLRSRVGALLQTCLGELRQAGVRFVSARVNGDHLDMVHALEDTGFRYFETVLWPVAPATAHVPDGAARVRLLEESDLPRAAQIAAEHGYGRTHFLCDAGFERERVAAMHAKWITSAWQAGDPVAVIEADGAVAGIFALRIDRRLSEYLGPTYGRMRFLAIDASMRGRGLGRALFQGSIALLRDMGADYVDSGYPTKNHMSAKLHCEIGFQPLYEEATFHLWL